MIRQDDTVNVDRCAAGDFAAGVHRAHGHGGRRVDAAFRVGAVRAAGIRAGAVREAA